MPFDYNEFSTSVSKAREAKVSDEDILSHLSSIDQGFKDAQDNGYSLNEIDSFLKEKYTTKGGDNNAYQTSQSSEGSSQNSNAESAFQGEVQAGSPQGIQANGEPSSQDISLVQGQDQAALKIRTSLTGDSSLGIGGEPLETQETMSVGPRYEGTQTEIQQAIPSQGKAGEQAEVATKPAKFPAVRSQGEDASLISRLVNMPTRGLAEGVYNIGAAISDMDAAFGPNILMAKAADSLFGTNSFSEQLRNAPKEAAASFRKYASSMRETPTEEKSIFNGLLYGTGKMIPDLALAALSDGASEAPALTKVISENTIWKDIADKSMHGIKSFALPSIIASQEAITAAKEQGKTDVQALTDGIRTLFSMEIGAILPLGVSAKNEIGKNIQNKIISNITNFASRGAEKFLKAYPLVVAQNEIMTMAGNIGAEQANRQPTVTENVITGKFGDAAKQLAGAVPMGLLGLLGGADEFTPGIGRNRKDLDKVAEYVSQAGLPETADVLKQVKSEEKPVKKFATRDTIIYNANKRYEDLSVKQKSGQELTPEEAVEFSILEKVPTVEELASQYGITIQETKNKPAKAKAEAQPEKPSETKEQIKETSGISSVEGKPIVAETTVKVEEGTPQREGEGKEKQVTPAPEAAPKEVKSVYRLTDATSIDEVNKHIEEKTAEINSLPSDANKKKSLLAQLKNDASNRKKQITDNRVNEIRIISDANTKEEVDGFVKKQKDYFDGAVERGALTSKSRNTQLANLRKQAFNKKAQIKEAELAAKPMAEKPITQPKPSKEPVIEAKAPEPEPIPEEAPMEKGEPKARKPRKEKPSEPMGTRVLSAAYRPNKGPNKGKVFYGASHKQAMLKAGMSWKEISETYAHPEEREGLEFGYKTDTNAFVSRDKAEQVARISGQADLAKLDADKALGFKMHSNHLSLDDYPEMAGQGENFGPGAMKKAEKGVPFDERDHNSDLVKSAQIHKDLAKGGFKGGTNYSAWSKAFEKTFKDAKKYSEAERFNLFKEGESLAGYSEFFNKDLNHAVNFPKQWAGKEVGDIKNESVDKSREDVRFTQKAIDDERIARGLNPVMKEAAIASGEHWEQAMEQINSREGYAASFISSLKTNVRVLSPVETSILRYSVAEAMAKRDTLAAKLARATDPRLIKRYSKEYSDAQIEYADMSELMSRTNSEAGRSLGFLRMLVKADYSLPTLITKARAAKRRSGAKDDALTNEEKNGLSKLSEEIDKTEKEYFDAVEKNKQKENMRGLIEYLEFSSRMISEFEGEKKAPKDEVERFTVMLKNNRQDPITMGLAVRGMARNLSELLKTKDAEKISNAVNDRISSFMGNNWEKSQTMDILNGSGAFPQKSQAGLLGSISRNNDKTFVFNKAFKKALKMKSPKEKQLQIAKILERFSVEVYNLESQVKTHLDDAIIDADRIIGELDYELLSCE